MLLAAAMSVAGMAVPSRVHGPLRFKGEALAPAVDGVGAPGLLGAPAAIACGAFPGEDDDGLAMYRTAAFSSWRADRPSLLGIERRRRGDVEGRHRDIDALAERGAAPPDLVVIPMAASDGLAGRRSKAV